MAVAPHVGAWIETTRVGCSCAKRTSSLPMWERGLKRVIDEVTPSPAVSLPMWERGLKRENALTTTIQIESLPMWERGLKLVGRHYQLVVLTVAPHVGAWIETCVRV